MTITIITIIIIYYDPSLLVLILSLFCDFNSILMKLGNQSAPLCTDGYDHMVSQKLKHMFAIF